MCFFILFIFITNFIYISQSFTQNPTLDSSTNTAANISTPESAVGLEIFQEPFKINFDKIWTFFRTNYESDLTLNLSTYYRRGDSTGSILSDLIYSNDNLNLYRTLLKEEIDYYETFDSYLKLRQSPMWYASSVNLDEFGFVSSINPNGVIIDDTRYLIDNLMPIFLLIENIGAQIDSVSIDTSTPKDSIEEIFGLLDSSQFWDTTYDGFYNSNSTNYKYAESNFYSVLALLEIHRLYKQENLDSSIRDRAFELANITLTKLIDELWDTSNDGFEYYGKRDWTSESGSSYKYLQTNALGIIALLEYWIESGMQNNSICIQYATDLFTTMEALWDGTAYEFSRDPFWGLAGANGTINLEANSIMMSACLKLFEYTGDITYYDRAWEIFNYFETNFYDSSVNAFDTSDVDTNKNFDANLQVIETYLNAFSIFNSTELISVFNVTDEIPDFIFNQDTLNITSTYSFKKEGLYYNTSTLSYESYTTEYKIDDATISYVMKYPDKEIFLKSSTSVTNESTTLLYNITDSLKLGNGYYLQIITNSSNFGTAYTINKFNVISGLVNSPIQGIPEILYQGPILNITLPINNTRNEDVTLTVSMEGDFINNEFQTITFNSLILTNVSFNLTATLGAIVGSHILNFTVKKDNITYLEILKSIEIGHSFDYTNFLYENKIVEGDSAFISLNLINFLPNVTQSLNLTFYEDSDIILRQEVFLNKNEIKLVYFNLNFSGSESHYANASMRISKGETDFYSRSFLIEIIQKYEIISVSFPDVVSQAESANFILIIQNNQENSESFSLEVNGEIIETNIKGLAPGVNRITAQIIPTLNPYDFESKSFIFEIKNSSGDVIARFYFEVGIELSPFMLILFYILPIAIPIGIILIYKNKEIKHRLLKR
jgi:hypothetical protein